MEAKGVTKDIYSFRIIDCINYIYIQRGDGRYSSSINGLLFDGVSAKPTLKSEWYKLDKVPTKVEKANPKKKENERWELKEGYSSSELMPQIITRNQYDSDEYEAVINCYKYMYDEIDGGYEEVEFEISKIYTKEDFEFIDNEYNAKSSELTQIEYPSALYQEFPCKLNREQVMDIIRTHVKKNIDRRYAEITSDYKFSFEVKKKINLYEPYSKLVDANNSWMNKRRKPKWVEKIIANKSESILHLSDGSSRNDYKTDLVPEIIGSNYEDLKVKVNEYLDNLMSIINTAYCECPHCQGWGLIKEEDLKND